MIVFGLNLASQGETLQTWNNYSNIFHARKKFSQTIPGKRVLSYL